MRGVRIWSVAAVVTMLVVPTIMARASDTTPGFRADTQGAKAPDTKAVVQPGAAFNKHDFNGVWLQVGGDYFDASKDANLGLEQDPPGFQIKPELKGKYLADYEKRRQELAKIGSEFKTTCRPLGMPALMVAPYANEIMQTPKQLNWFQEYPGETRRIYLDGRPRPSADEYPATYTGYSTGRWDGDTLVVETMNIRTDATFEDQAHSDAGLGHSDKIRIIERMRLVAANQLQVDTTVEDPDALVKPWHYILNYNRHPGQEIIEFVCEDNNRESIDPATGREVTEIPPLKTQR